MTITVSYEFYTVVPEFLANGFQNADQFGSTVVGLVGGGFAIAYGNDFGSFLTPHVSLFDAAGTPVVGDLGSFFLPYKGTAAGVQMIGAPEVEQLLDGNVMVAWNAVGSSFGTQLLTTVLNPRTGEIVQPETIVQNMHETTSFDTARLAGGNRVYVLDGNIGGHLTVRTGAGTHIGSFLFGDSFERYHTIAVVALSDGTFAVCSLLNSAPALMYEVRANGGVRSGATIRIDLPGSTNIGAPAMAALPQGGFAVAFANTSDGSPGLSLLIITNSAIDPTPIGPIRVDTDLAAVESEASVTVLANGFILVSWTQTNGEGDTDIMGRLFSADGVPLPVDGTDAPFVIAGENSAASESALAALGQGRFITTWTDSEPDADGNSIRGEVQSLIRHTEGDSGPNQMTGDSLTDIMDAGSGNDTLNGLGGDDSLDGGQGDDRLSGSDGDDRLFGGDGNDGIDGGQGDDSLDGRQGADTLYGGDGNDRLDGEAGIDYAAGGPGDDVYIVNDGADIVVELGYQGHDTVHSSVSFALPGHVEDLVLTGTGAMDAGGNGASNRLTGNAFDNRLTGGAGDDYIAGGAGIDTAVFALNSTAVKVEFLGDTLRFFSAVGTDMVNGDVEFFAFTDGTYSLAELRAASLASSVPSQGDDVLVGTAAPDTLDGLGGNDRFGGRSGNDTLKGGMGNDTLSGEGGNDWMTGGRGSDRLIGDAGDDRLYGDDFKAVYALDEAVQVYRMYQATLGRAPDVSGLEDWTRQLDTGRISENDLAAGFVNSREFQNIYGALDTESFVTLLYQNVLGRAPDAAGLASWMGRLDTGTSREAVVLGFSDSREFINATQSAATSFIGARVEARWSDDVYRVYQATLGREPDAGGFANWTGQLAEGVSFLSVVSGFTDSREFQRDYGALDNAGFVTLLYNNVLHRAPDVGGLADWVGRLEAGTSREQVVEGFAQSREFVNASAPRLKEFMRGLGENDEIRGGVGDDILWGGALADRFVFNANSDGTQRVMDLEAWDWLEFNGFGYADASDVRAHMVQVGADVIFSDSGVTVVLANTLIAALGDDVFLGDTIFH